MKNIYQKFTLTMLAIFSLAFAEQLESKIESGTIILLNGTSSAGKSSLCKELQKIYGNGFKVVSNDDFFDNFIANLENKEDEIDWEKVVIDFYTHIRNLSDAGHVVLIDTVQHEEQYEKFNEILGSKLIKVLVYCPLDILVDHVEKRNASGDLEERRSVCQACGQFLGLYTMQKTDEDVFVDRVTTDKIEYALQKAQEEIHRWMIEKSDDHQPDNQKYYDERYQKFVEQFDLQGQSHEIVLTQIYPWDLIVNTGINSSATVAQQIIDFLESSTN